MKTLLRMALACMLIAVCVLSGCAGRKEAPDATTGASVDKWLQKVGGGPSQDTKAEHGD